MKIQGDVSFLYTILYFSRLNGSIFWMFFNSTIFIYRLNLNINACVKQMLILNDTYQLKKRFNYKVNLKVDQENSNFCYEGITLILRFCFKTNL